MINLDLTGKRAVVTGASLGIGEATVKMLAEHGADVSFCARTPESVDKLVSSKIANGSIKGFVADMGERDSTQSFIDNVLTEGNIDILVNNVGASPSRNFLYMTDEDWQDYMNSIFYLRSDAQDLFFPVCEKKWGRWL